MSGMKVFRKLYNYSICSVYNETKVENLQVNYHEFHQNQKKLIEQVY